MFWPPGVVKDNPIFARQNDYIFLNKINHSGQITNQPKYIFPKSRNTDLNSDVKIIAWLFENTTETKLSKMTI